ncbi:MAG: pyrroline-5-carboxylate reductase [Sheuella sp.]|jgi:pyrroline-5-carboxylate reductase|nr:pyrroline-5-carboxylate reductase [Sheuella sp.]
MNNFPSIAVIGGGNMANALVSGWLNQGCPASQILIIELSEPLRAQWQARGVNVASGPDSLLSTYAVWVYAVKPQQMREVVLSTRPFIGSDTLVISIAAGISIDSLSTWLGSASEGYSHVVRCMPNTPALVAAGVTGMAAPAALSTSERHLATNLLSAVGQAVWVDSDQSIDAVTALSGSGPAYVFLFLESLIEGAVELGLSAEQARKLALATLAGSTELAIASVDSPSVLRERVTSKGGTTAAALDVFRNNNFTSIVKQAMRAADVRAAELSKEFGN